MQLLNIRLKHGVLIYSCISNWS